MSQWTLKSLGFVGLFLAGLTSCQSDSLDRLTTTQAQAQQLYSVAGTEALGNPRGPITLVVISSYECHYCRKDYPIIKQYVAAHPSIKLIYKSYLAFGLDTLVEPQYAALAAAKQNQFAAMHDALFTTESPLDKTTIMTIAKTLKLNQRQFLKDSQSDAISQQVIANTELIDQLGIQGIPTVIMAPSDVVKNNKLTQYIQVGFITPDVLDEMLQAVSKK